ncbi:MAG: response regulator transcription factor [Patescibacteria group bacterium]
MPDLNKTILIAEDEVPMARALDLKLSSEGFTVHVAHNGEEAIELYKEHKPDLILLDLIMPKKDGFMVLDELKELGNTAPVLVASNLSQKVDQMKAEEKGAKEYYVKSDTPLVKIVEKVRGNLGL